MSLSEGHPGIKCIYRSADVSNYDSVEKAVKSVTEELGSVDILVNNVCMIRRSSIPSNL